MYPFEKILTPPFNSAILRSTRRDPVHVVSGPKEGPGEHVSGNDAAGITPTAAARWQGMLRHPGGWNDEFVVSIPEYAD